MENEKQFKEYFSPEDELIDKQDVSRWASHMIRIHKDAAIKVNNLDQIAHYEQELARLHGRTMEAKSIRAYAKNILFTHIIGLNRDSLVISDLLGRTMYLIDKLCPDESVK